MAQQRSFRLTITIACVLSAAACADAGADGAFDFWDAAVQSGPTGGGGTTGNVSAPSGTTGVAPTFPGGASGGPGSALGGPGSTMDGSVSPVGGSGSALGGAGGTTSGRGGTTGGAASTMGGAGGSDSSPGGTTSGPGSTMGGTSSTAGGGGSTMGGAGSSAGGSSGGGTGGSGGMPGCPCNTPPPAQLPGGAAGPFKYQNVGLESGSAYLPDGPGPFAAIAVIGGFTNVGPEMEFWGTFYASWGIAAVITFSSPIDTPDIRAAWLLGAISELKQQNTTQGSPFFGKLSGQYGTSGYSMGGGGTTIASTEDKTLRSSIGLAPWSPVGRGITTPTLHFCGDLDVVAPCSYAQSSYSAIPSATPKMMITVSGCDHLTCWFSPDLTTDAISGSYALAFNKVYLEGDMRWKPLLLQKPANHSVQTNIK